MWYFTWILGLGAALAFGIINVMWLEASYTFGELDEERIRGSLRRLLKEAGYAGQPVRWITTREYEWMYKTALVAKQQLEQVGFVVDLQVLDWATLVQKSARLKGMGTCTERTMAS